MRRLLYFILCFGFFASCSQRKKDNGLKDSIRNSSEIEKGGQVPKADSIKNKSDVSINDTTTYNEAPGITPLPFGFKSASKNFDDARQYFTRLLYQNKSITIVDRWPKQISLRQKIYKLPPIKSVKYIAFPVSTGFDGWNGDTCTNGVAFEKYIKLTKYRYRLPDIGKYQCYYWCDYRNLTSSKEYPEDVLIACKFFLSDLLYGYFILYDPETMSAKVFMIYFDTNDDGSDAYRFFYIDKNHNIMLYPPNNGVLISISSNGELQIKK